MSKHVIRKGLSTTDSKIHITVTKGNGFIIRKLVQSTLEAIQIKAQGDTGANVSASNNLEVIHEYKPYKTPQAVGVFSASGEEHEDTLMAEGEGVMKMISDQGTIMRWTTVYTPNSTGTVLSPDNYQRSNIPKFNAFQHTGKLDNHGSISFLNKSNCVIESVSLRRTSNGEWYTTNKVLVKNTMENEHLVKQVSMYKTREANHLTMGINEVTAETQDTPKVKSWTSGLSTALKNLELWHQRYGHISPTTLSKTQKVVEGMPPIPSTNPPFFKCPFCEKAKMTKYSGKAKAKKELFIPGQAYHMDLSFVSGPSNLQDVLTKNEKAKATLKKSRNGYIGFLTIIDATTRALWTHPIKSKDPPIAFVDKFLKKHGIRATDPGKAIITTNKDGYLATSKAFETTLKDHQYTMHANDIDYLADIDPEHLNCTIMTDGGGEILKSNQFQTTCGNHGYDVNWNG